MWVFYSLFLQILYLHRKYQIPKLKDYNTNTLCSHEKNRSGKYEI